MGRVEPVGSESPLLGELLWVHEWLRRDLRQCQEIAREARAGVAVQQVQERIQGLQTSGPLWKLRTSCLQYCALVHNHHESEDTLLFPVVRRYAPELGELLDRLEHDHREVAEMLEKITSAADALVGSEGEAARDRLAAGLEQLAGHLVDHIELEERTLAPVLVRHRMDRATLGL